MLRHSYSLILATLALIVAPLSIHAMEETAKSTETKLHESSFDETINGLFDQMESQISHAIFQRMEGDRLIREDLYAAVAQFTNRLDTVENTINTLDNRFTEIKTLLTQDISSTRGEIIQLNTDLQGNVNYILNRITQTYGNINSHVSNLQNQISNQQASINSLYSQTTAIDQRLTAMEAFATSLQSQIEALARCVADASCLTRANISLQRQVFTIYTGEAIAAGTASRTVCWGGFLGMFQTCGLEYYTIYEYGTKSLGIYYPTWQYCAITGIQNQDVRNYHIYLSGNQWTLRNETKEQAGTFGQEGYVYATCIRLP